MRKLLGILIILGVLALSLGCTADLGQAKDYVAQIEGTLGQFAPIFHVHGTERRYNRIGTPTAELVNGKERIFVDPSKPSIFILQRSFQTESSSYTNLIYRIHFERVPMSRLTGGRNVGLIFIVTLNRLKQPILVTTVHTCGCYKATIPTDYLPKESFPDDYRWNTEHIRVFGEKLPRILKFKNKVSPRIMAVIRPETHRFMDLQVVSELPGNRENMAVLPMVNLTKLDLGNGETTSFYHESGSKRAFVKGSYKLWETLFMSWMAWDLWIGSDKAYADTDKSGNRFYTSLKPWRRRQSDLWHFADYLKCWGWKLP